LLTASELPSSWSIDYAEKYLVGHSYDKIALFVAVLGIVKNFNHERVGKRFFAVSNVTPCLA
jgi:hypothetical protein